ncbi:MAG: AbrB/MazE/SpoVT family DNA-binding domain-containing protein [Chloroflexi bacterium]|nr:AbrB/MazE/SpoVT family DNA-binding domain-containing protein [Chloroflexota bacterium]
MTESWDEHFEELIVLDSAGRLQIPKQYREQLGFENRVEMEVTGESILIRPAKNLDDTSSQGEIQLEREIPVDEMGSRPRLLDLLRRKS